ncbi:MAG: 3-phosphoshikimate 1-carboxyvinyltransferase [Alphaproteobacteria bacterium]|nr:3-phosphoshikimate 1-carboxyvinyltransferase [Alphaproteobacteria bacterium]
MTAAKSLNPMISRKSQNLRATITPPGDKSISHRSLMFGAVASGRTDIHGLLEGEDVLHTAAAMRALGAKVTKHPGGTWEVEGCGVGNFKEPADTLEMGNSGTSTRLLMGLLASQGITTAFDGDASLRKRPMGRVMEPLVQMGANFISRDGGKLPLTMMGTGNAKPIVYRLPVASAQVKSAILLAGLNAKGDTVVIEPTPTRDHSEIMLKQFGASIDLWTETDGAQRITLHGPAQLKGQEVFVPADPSSAAFPMVAALLCPRSELVLKDVGMNPRRTGLLTTLQEMGADITVTPTPAAGEARATLTVRYGTLRAVDVPAERAPSMIDEYPILAMAAACANGTTRMRGLGELRVKESDRLAMVADGLRAAGADVTIDGDDLIVSGNGQPPRGGCLIATAMDHRIAMSFLVLGLATEQPITIDDGSFIETSFPAFATLMRDAGAQIETMPPVRATA